MDEVTSDKIDRGRSDLLPTKQSISSSLRILRVGVTELRFVTLNNARPWLIHSLRHSSGQTYTNLHADTGQSVPSSSDQQAGNTHPAESHVTDSVSVGFCNTAYGRGVEGSSRQQIECVTDLSFSTPRHDQWGERIDPSSSGHDQTLKRKHEDSNPETPGKRSLYEKVRLICRPWRKPEGALNRSMLKLLLESVLVFIMTNPGISETGVIDKFSPHLQPIVVKEIIEILDELECLSKTFLKKTRKSSLFARASTQVVHTTYDADTLVYEANIDCSFKLGQFLAYLCSSS